MNINARITAAGLKLAEVTVTTPQLGRVLGRRTRRRMAVIIASAMVIATGSITFIADSLNNQSAAEAWTYVLPLDGATPELDLDGATPLPTERFTARTGDAALWVDLTSGRYLSLNSRPGLADGYPAPVGLGPMAPSESFPETQGQAYLTQSDESHVRTMTMWWTRADGAVWILRSYWYGDDPVPLGEAQRTLENWALEISDVSSADPKDSFHLGDAAMTLFAAGRLGDVGSQAQVWDFRRGTQQGKIILLTIEDTAAVGLSNLLAHGMPTEIILFGRMAWKVIDNAGQIYVGWQSGSAKQDWTTLTIPSSVASYAGEILSALRIE